jgi:serine/threonine-protein kinase RsbW
MQDAKGVTVTSSVRAQMTLRLPFSTESVAVARAGLRAWMVDVGGTPEAVEDARIVVSELVANSVRHARPLADGKLMVAWSVDDDGVTLSVTDGGSPTLPRNVHAPSSALAGRGIAIIEQLSKKWWTETTRARSTVHALLDV